MKRFRWIRSVVKWCLAGLVGVVVLLLCSDWWLPSVLPSVLRQWDVTVSSVSRGESGRWKLTDLSYANDAVSVSADVVEMPSASRLAGAFWRGEGLGALQVDAGVLHVTLAEAAEPSAAREPVDVVSVLNTARAAWSEFELWVPALAVDTLSVEQGTIRLLELSDVLLQDGKLVTVAQSVYLPDPVSLEADLSEAATWDLLVHSEAHGLGLVARMDFKAMTEVVIDLSLSQKAETLRGVVQWCEGKRFPCEVELETDVFTVQQRWLSDLGVTRLASVEVSDLRLVWTGEAYEGRFALAAELPMDAHEALPLDAQFAVSGTLDVLSVESCELSGTWGDLALSNVLKVDLQERAVLEGADLVASLNLAEQDWIPARGQLSGLVSVAPDSVDGLDVRFDLKGEDLSYGGYEAETVALAGEVHGSVITLERLQLDIFEGTDADRMAISGIADWEARTLDLSYEAALGAEWLNALLREEYFVDALRGKGRVFGSFDAPELEGVVEPVTLNHSLLHPVTLSGEVRSLSEGAIDVDLTAQCEGAEALLDLAVEHRKGVCSVNLEQIVISDPELSTVRLLQPASIRFDTKAVPGERLLVDPVHLKSDTGEASMTWGAKDGFNLSLRNMDSDRIDRWLRRDFPRHQVDVLELALTQLQPKILGELEVRGRVESLGGEVLGLDVLSQIEKEGVVFERLALQFDDAVLLSGTLALPLRLQIPHEDLPLWVAIPQGHMSGEVKGQTTDAFTQWLERLVDVSFEDASVDLSLSGFWMDPLGTLDVTVARLDVSQRFPELELPQLTDLRLKARVDESVCELSSLECFVNESAVAGAVLVPLEAIFTHLDVGELAELDWAGLLDQASGRVELTDWQFENWRHRFPVVMRRSGELNGVLELKPGLDMVGNVELKNFALRPTLAYSMIDQIEAELELADRKVTVKRASARVGGSPVTMSGWIDGTNWDEPLWEFAAQGERVPLVRTNDLILRSDLDLTLKRLAVEDVPKLSGELNFRQSTYLVEFDPMAPSVESGPSHQPPYFSITTPAIADWEFDVIGKGDAFFRVRSPYFRALVSANLQLGGTFLKPELVGGLRVDSGDMLFPSVKMELDHGEAFIEPTRPNEVQLDFSGVAQIASYVVTLEVEDTLDDASVHFSSTPSLPNSEIVRLLATGGLSGGEVGAVGVYLGKGLLGVGAGGVDSSLADRLTFEVGEAGGRDGGNTFSVQYRINDDLYLRGGYDIYEAHNVDLLWSIFRR